MLDMNFFSQFNKKKNRSDSSTMILIGLVSLVGLFILVTLLYTSISIYYNKSEATKYVAKLEAPAMQKKIQESNEIDNKISSLTQYNNSVASLNTDIKSREVVSTNLLNNLRSTKPSDVSFSSLNITSASVIMVGNSKSMSAISELEHNLKQLSGVASVYIPSITPKEDNSFDFSVTCTMKGVN